MVFEKVNEGIIEKIREGGIGSEATVDVELRTRFPGIGGTIITQEGAVTASRVEHHIVPKAGHSMFLKHMIFKKIDDYFYRIGVYKYAHVPRPLGSVSIVNGKKFEAYIYEWVHGDEGFPWEIKDEYGEAVNVHLSDWNEFVKHFKEAGVEMNNDITDADDGRISKNVIHSFSSDLKQNKLSSIWKRIDFGKHSILIDYDRLWNYLQKNKSHLINVLRKERFHMIELAAAFLRNRGNMKEYEVGTLETLIGDYRRSSLVHLVSRGSGSTSVIYQNEESPEPSLL